MQEFAHFLHAFSRITMSWRKYLKGRQGSGFARSRAFYSRENWNSRENGNTRENRNSRGFFVRFREFSFSITSVFSIFRYLKGLQGSGFLRYRAFYSRENWNSRENGNSRENRNSRGFFRKISGILVQYHFCIFDFISKFFPIIRGEITMFNCLIWEWVNFSCILDHFGLPQSVRIICVLLENWKFAAKNNYK